jgi:hypothetical protein
MPTCLERVKPKHKKAVSLNFQVYRLRFGLYVIDSRVYQNNIYLYGLKWFNQATIMTF